MKKLLYIGAGFLLLCSAVFRFIFAGYGTMALVLFFGAVCCAFFGVLHGKKEKNARIMRITAIAVLIIGFGCFMAAETPVLQGSRSDEDTSAEYVIVMGAGVNGHEPSMSLQSRLETAYRWLSENPESIAILSGCQGRGEFISEAQCMYDWLSARGIDSHRLIMEDQATNSYKNIEYSLEILDTLGFDRSAPLAIISSDYHLCRIRMLAENFGCNAVCESAKTPYISLYLNCAIREAFALWEIWVFGYGV